MVSFRAVRNSKLQEWNKIVIKFAVNKRYILKSVIFTRGCKELKNHLGPGKQPDRPGI